MIKYIALRAGLTALICFGVAWACTPAQFSKEQELYDEVARYACYAAAGQKATVALHDSCPDLLKDAKGPLSCPILDLVIDVLQKDLEACDAE